MEIIKILFKVIFSRATIAILSLVIQLVVIFLSIYFFSKYIVWIFGGFTVLSIIVAIYILNKNQNPSYKIAWIIPIFALPVFGVCLYLLVQFQYGSKVINNGLQNIRKKTKLFLKQETSVNTSLKEDNVLFNNFASYMYNYGDFPIYQNTKMDYFSVGETQFEDMVKEIRKAKKYIFLEYFIIQKGYMWNTILEILKEKVKEGVEVRVIYDGMCMIASLPFNYPKELAKFGIKCKIFSPIKPIFSTYQNNRDHRKICIIDGKIAYTGGANLADEYINKINRFGHWKDTAIKLSGEAVNTFTILFLEMWNLKETEEEIYENYLVGKKDDFEEELGYVLLYADNPFDNYEIGKQVYLDIMNQAKEFLHIITPYLVLDHELLNTLIYLARKGIDVKIIMPNIPDKKLVYYLGRSFYSELIRSGVKIYEYIPGFPHAKVFSCDLDKATVSSINLDYRSLYLHFECGVLIYKNKVINDIENDFQETLKKCKKITLEEIKKYPLWKRLIGRLLRLFSPLM